MCSRCWKSCSRSSASGCGNERERGKKSAAALLLLTALALSSACSAAPPELLPPRPILDSLTRMCRGDQPGVWMDDADAANLVLYVDELERVCR